MSAHPLRLFQEAWVDLRDIGPTRKALEDSLYEEILLNGLILRGRVDLDVRPNPKTGRAHIIASGLGVPPYLSDDEPGARTKIAEAIARRNKIPPP